MNTPVFNMFVHGCGLQGRERFGDLVGAVPEDRIPDMVVEIGKAVEESGLTFDRWFSSTDGFNEIASRYVV